MEQSLIEDSLKYVKNRFELVRIVSNRAKLLTKGQKPLIETKGEKHIMVSLREVAENKVYLIEDDLHGNDK